MNNSTQHSAFKGTSAVASAIITNQVLRKNGGSAKMHATNGEDAGDQQPGEPEPVDPAGDGQPVDLESPAPAEDATQAGRDLEEEERTSER